MSNTQYAPNTMLVNTNEELSKLHMCTHTFITQTHSLHLKINIIGHIQNIKTFI